MSWKCKIVRMLQISPYNSVVKAWMEEIRELNTLHMDVEMRRKFIGYKK